MWTIIARIILRQKYLLLVIIGVLTVFMAFMATKVQLTYELAKMLPANDSTSIQYDIFKNRFGEDGNVFAVGVVNKNIFQLDEFNAFYDLGNKIKQIDGIQEVVSIARTINITKNDSTRKFDFKQVVNSRPKTQQEVDSLKKVILSLAFFDGLLFNKESNTYLMAISLDRKKLNDKSRVELVLSVKKEIESYREKHKVEVHYSGLPYIRTLTSIMIEKELLLFIVLSLIISAVIMILFFRSLKVVLSSMILVTLSIIWTLGTAALLGYKITILTGVIPSLVTIIAIENCIYLINKYHWEYKNHGNKVKALSQVIRRIGFATFLTNITTATGFATFIFTSNSMLKEFGVVASINVIVEFIMSLILIPIIFSFLKPPSEKQVKHLNNKKVNFIIEKITYIIFNKKSIVYPICAVFIGICIYGLTLMKTSGKLVDDLKENDPIYIDLKFFEKNFSGVMPFEISIDTKKKNGVIKLSTIQKIDKLQTEVEKMPYFSKPLSLAELVKFSKQAFYRGNQEKYSLPNNQEKTFILSYIPTKDENKKNVLHSFIDSTKQFTRISFQMADIGLTEINEVLKIIKPKVDSIFDPKDYNVVITGNSLVYTKGTEFLVKNLIESVLLGILMISLLIALVFSSYRMVIIAMICNLIPLLSTAAIMGFARIPVKPSTLIVFSVALGISIDNAILFLSKYRHELKLQNGVIKISIAKALNETGISMIYSSIVLVLGFGVFMFSDFGGTQALGVLISLTLFVALFFNIIVLPSLIISFNNFATTKSFREPLIEMFDDEEDIELDDLKLVNSDNEKE